MSEQKGLVLDFTGVVCVWGGSHSPPPPHRGMQRQPGLRGMHDNELPELFKGPLG